MKNLEEDDCNSDSEQLVISSSISDETNDTRMDEDSEKIQLQVLHWEDGVTSSTEEF